MVTAADLSSGVLALNPGVVDLGDELLMAVRVDLGSPGDPDITGSEIVFATSVDGVNWSVDADRRTIDRTAAIGLLAACEPHRDLALEVWRVYDPRLTAITVDGASSQLLVMSVAVDTTHGLRPGLFVSDDAGRSWTCVHLGLPDNRNVVLFPEQIDGRWCRLDRPFQEYGGEAMGAGRHGAWISRSADLVHWGEHRFLIDVDGFGFGDSKLGPGSPPVRTSAGWLCLFHVVEEVDAAIPRGWEPSWNRRYVVGALLLDLDDPSIVIAACDRPVLQPEVDFETSGFRDDVVFPTGAVVRSSGADGADEIWLYYGAADTCVGLAVARVDDVVDFVVEHRR